MSANASPSAVRSSLERHPHGGELVGVLGDVRLAGGGQAQAATAALVVRLEQALVLELRDGRVDRAGARAPAAVAALGDLLDDLVAVDRLVGLVGGAHHVEDRGPHVAAADPRPALAVALGEAEEAGHPRRRARGGPGGRSRPARTGPRAVAPATSAAAAASVLAALLVAVLRPLSIESWVSHVGTPSSCVCVCSGIAGRQFWNCRQPVAIYRERTSRVVATQAAGVRHTRFTGEAGGSRASAKPEN